MADYYYNGSAANYNSKGRFGAKFQSWDMVHSGTKGDADGWSNSPFLGQVDKRSDDVCRPGVLGREEEPPKVREFTRSVQTAAFGERRMGFPAGMFQPRTDNRDGYISYENGSDTSTYGWKKHGSGYAADAAQEHLLITGNPGWATPTSYGTPLSRATNDTETAVGYMKGSARAPPVAMSGTNHWSRGTPAMLSNSSSSGVTTIESREAAKKYNGYFM